MYSLPRHYIVVSGQLHTPAALPPRKQCRLDTMAGGLQSRSGHGGEGKNILTPAGNQAPVVHSGA
jgi:hypothetical protein